MPLRLIKNTNNWRVGKFERFLHLGKMVRPLKYQCSKKTFGYTWGKEHTYVFDSILSAAYTDGKETYQFFINYDEIEEKVILPKEGMEAIFDEAKESVILPTNELIVPPLSLVAVKIN